MAKEAAIMAEELSVIVDSIPDNDSFLPRYLTAQLIGILASALGAPAIVTSSNLSAQATQFINERKKLDLFTPLTKSIFWRENAEEVLATYTQPLDDLDKYSRSALTIALASENFILANNLLLKGATVFLEDKVVLEIALTSMLQRDASIMAKIMAVVTEPDDKIWVQTYLNYLHAFISGDASNEARKLRDVINPTVRHFGQILDTLVYFNGTPSHYGFLSPSLQVLTKHLQLYIKELKNPEELAVFSSIAKAYDITDQACRFNGNFPLNKNAAELLSAQVISNIKINSKEPKVIFGGWAGNSIAIAFVNKTLIFSNLGTGGDPQQGTKIYTIANQDAITTEAINKFICGLGNAAAPADILAILGDIVNPTAIFTINQALNPIDNCIFVNPRAIIQGLILVTTAAKKQADITAEILNSVSAKAAEQYNLYLDDLYKSSSYDLSKFMRNNELLKNKRIECCSLALEYINQHYQDPQALQRCIDLKNALEFVGLKDYYNSNIIPEAKAKIQAQVIHEQELTAIQVIEKEAEILAKQG